MATLFKSFKRFIKIDIDESTTSIAQLNVSTSLDSPLSTPDVLPTTPSKVCATPTPYSVESVLEQQGYNPLLTVAKTLQGSIWKVSARKQKNQLHDDDTYIVKVTNKSLHDQQIAYVDGKSYSIQENIVKEVSILKYLSSSDAPPQLVGYSDHFWDARNYFLIMEDAGMNMFEFTKESHVLIRNKTIDIPHWHTFCKNAMKQMAEVMYWLHHEMNVCHLDVSLENFTIKNMNTRVIMRRSKYGSSPKMELDNEFQIKIIDFGVAEVFASRKPDGLVDFRCKKYVGKTGYKAPKVYNKKRIFDARSADCWSLAVVFFMMIFGCPPFHKASKKDMLFTYIMNGRLVDVVESWEMLDYATPEICDLLLRLFVSEKYRLTMGEIKEHCWFK
eukprot:684304_1